MQLQKDKKATMQTLINSISKVNIIILAYAKELDFQTQKTNVDAPKIDSL